MLGGMLMAFALYFPGSHLIARAANPALVAAQASTPVVVETDLSKCSSQFDPTGTAKFTSACDIAKSILVARGISHSDRASADGQTRVVAGSESIAIPDGGGTSDLKALKAETATRIGAALEAAGYPRSADPEAIDYPLLLAVLLLFVIASTALYGPQAAALVEMFPTRIRYTALSLPYHVGTGWVGGFLPVTSFAIVAMTGNIYAGLWYAVAFTMLAAIVTVFMVKETAGTPLDEV
jgi:hypothetical protein